MRAVHSCKSWFFVEIEIDNSTVSNREIITLVVVVVVLLFYVQGKHLRSCQDGQLT